MTDSSAPQDRPDNLACALRHLRGRYGSEEISLGCLLQHAEVAIFLEQRRFSARELAQVLGELQQIGRIHAAASGQARAPSDHERRSVDTSMDSIFSALDMK